MPKRGDELESLAPNGDALPLDHHISVPVRVLFSYVFLHSSAHIWQGNIFTGGGDGTAGAVVLGAIITVLYMHSFLFTRLIITYFNSYFIITFPLIVFIKSVKFLDQLPLHFFATQEP